MKIFALLLLFVYPLADSSLHLKVVGMDYKSEEILVLLTAHNAYIMASLADGEVELWVRKGEFFDNIGHEWMMRFLHQEIADRRILRLIRKWLKAWVSEDGEWRETKQGTPQGAVISALLANVYLHYVFDLWVQDWRKKSADGGVILVRYADDFVLGFEHRIEAGRFLEELRERLAEFGLELHPDKTRLIEFGR